MSTQDVNETNGAEDAHRQESGGKKKSGGDYAVLIFLLAFVGSLIVGWVVYPKFLYSKKEQPFNFNHALHMEEVDDGCNSCHFYRDDGTFSGVPKLAQCVDCHEEVAGETEDEAVFVEEYVAVGKEVPWLVYAKQPDCVFFSHAAHTVLAEMECKVCHGDIGESTTLRPYEENRLTGYSRDIWGKNIGGFKKNSWDRMKMDDCAQCHKEETGDKGSCFQCHK